ncbi:MAG: tRNA preQ1(34) S-adenosylmethionine ribosyltransferase-isomerase QueA [bacterium]|nr:tRNA preQ1(34) S-adenosylmethionine ribosyltransferase-isomerase QueA [bacterium]
MKTSDFDFDLPESAIAQEPAEPRDAARMLVHDVASGATRHRVVSEITAELEAGDLLVVNDTKVLPARLAGRRASGGALELLLVGPTGHGRAWRALARPAKKLKPGEVVELAGGRLRARLVERDLDADGRPAATWVLELEDGEPGRESGGDATVEELLEREGRMPLPPYIRRDVLGDARDARDRERYQTVYARSAGAVAAPTAGLHLTEELLERLEACGVERAAVTLHVGLGTFSPVTAEEVAQHSMHSERFALDAETVDAVGRCRARGGRVVAVGTTTVRVLESCAREDGSLVAGAGETSIFITPGYRFRAVDGLLTNFHLPRSTLLMLVSALTGRERALGLYGEAIARGYRFYSYGDATLILP